MTDRQPATRPTRGTPRRTFLALGAVAVGSTTFPIGRVRGGRSHQDGDDGKNGDDGTTTGEGQGDEEQRLDPDLCSPDDHEHALAIDNRYAPFPVGRQLRLEGEEDGTSLEVEITVLDETEDVGDVTTRVVEERESEDGELIEVSRNFFAQTEAGTVCYFGEAVEEYEDGEVVVAADAWRADEPGNAPGIYMPADPQVGMVFAREVAPGVAEDEAEILAVGESVTVPAGTFEDALRAVERNPLEPGGTGDRKIYAAGVGLIADETLELVEYVE